jgi:transglutaminase-like putative cysteine protease
MPQPTPSTVPFTRPHWSAAAASILAMATLWDAKHQFFGLPILASAIVIAMLIRPRLPRQPLIVWLVRLTVLATIYLTALDPVHFRGNPWDLDPEYLNLFGYLCAAELAFQFWLKRPRPPNGEILVLSMFVLVNGCAVYEVRRWWASTPVWFAAPIYAVLLATWLRNFRPRPPQPQPRARPRFIAMRWLAIGIALEVGLFTALGVRAYGDRISIFPFHNLLGTRSQPVGLSRTPRLAPSANDGPSLARALRIDGPFSAGHLRAMSFDDYVNGNWLVSPDLRAIQSLSRQQLHADAPGPRLTVTRFAALDGLLPAPLWAAGIAPPIDAQVNCDAAPTLRQPMFDDAPEPYHIILGPNDRHQGPLASPPTEQQRKFFLAVPTSIAPFLHDLATRIANQPDPAQRAAAIEQYLLLHYAYSLNIPASKGDPLIEFLFNRKTGHCQYFASAAVLLCRSAGVPARFVTGFYAHERAGEGSIIVRQRDAHAWAEVWIEGTGWITLDATPGSGRPDGLYGDIGWWQRLQEWVQDRFADFKLWLASLGWPKIILGVALIVIGGATLKWLFDTLRAWRPKRPRQRAIYPHGHLASIAIAFDRLLRRRGRPCASNQTWSEHLQQLDASPTSRLNLQLARDFVHRYQLARFGRSSPDADVAELQQILGSLNDHNRPH